MQKKEFIEKLAQKLESTKAEAEKNLNAVFELISALMSQKEEFMVPGFGKFATRDNPTRKGRNPSTGKEISIATKTVPTFKPAASLKLLLNSN